MTDFPTHTLSTAPEGSKSLLEGVQRNVGFIPNLMGTMAQSPALLESYITLSRLFGSTSLSETERQIIAMTNNRLNDCHYCMAAHSVISAKNGVAEDVIEALRTNQPIADAKLEALRQFTIEMHESRGWPSEAALQAFLNAGYSQQSVLEVVLGMAYKVLSNYTNHLAETDIDKAFLPGKWSPDMAGK